MSTVISTPSPTPRDLATLTKLYCRSASATLESDSQLGQELQAVLLDCAPRDIDMEIGYPAERHEQVPPQDWMSDSKGCSPSTHYLKMKSCLDFIGALFLFAVAAPIMALVALAIKLTSSGPVLFQQVRVGKDETGFILYKFRSMPEDAEAITGPVWSGDGDSRATPVGRLLRKFRLDELPQLFNVLRGEMSLVGPRPERPCFVYFLQRLIPSYNLRHTVKPGITGLAQVFYPYGASVEDACEKLRYDLHYAQHISPGLDLLVLARTIHVVLAGRGH